MGNIAIIQARGGSKRLPRKNVLPFRGRPIVAYTVEAAGRSGLFEVVVVSTEDEEIQAAVQGLECEIHRRPPKLASDTARVVDVLREVLDEQGRGGREFDFLCCLYPTAPMRDAQDIKTAYTVLVEQQMDYCIGVVVHREGGKRIVVDNGSMYWVRVGAFLAAGELVGPKAAGYVMPRWRSVDIDEREDLNLAEFFASEYLGAR